MKSIKEKLAIIGAGKLGSALAKALYKEQYRIVALIDQNISSARKVQTSVKAQITSNRVADIIDSDIIFICVPDDEIRIVVFDLQVVCKQSQNVRFVFHTSGALTSDVFERLRTYPIACASLHPIQAFSGTADDWKKLYHIYFGLEGDPPAIDKAREIVTTLKSDKIIIPKQVKPLYHLACTMASNYLVSLIATVVDLLKEINLSEPEVLKVLYPLLATTLMNVRNQGVLGAVTGPISRGDIGTVEKHLELLSNRCSNYKLIYQSLGKMVLNLILSNAGITDQKFEQMKQLLYEKKA